MIPSVECVNLDLHDRAEKAEAEVARLKELQPCGHPVQAIRSTPYIGNQHSNYCGWCADVEHEHELCQTLTVELLAYRERVARLREALEAVEWRRIEGVHGIFNECPWCEWVDVDGHADDCQRQSALSTPAAIREQEDEHHVES